MMIKTKGTCKLVSENECAVPVGMMGGGKKTYKGKTCAVAMKLHDAERRPPTPPKPALPPTTLKPTFSKPVVMDGSRRPPPPTPPKPVAKPVAKEETEEEKDGGEIDRLIRKSERASGCCKDFKATCMACAAEMSIKKYCAHNPRMTGCERKPAAASGSESTSGSDRSRRPVSNRENRGAARREVEELRVEHAAAVNALTELPAPRSWSHAPPPHAVEEQ
jgi:hypothetical protein